MASALAQLIRQCAAGVDGKTVTIELICADEYAAQVLFDDVRQRLGSEAGLELWIKAKEIEEKVG